MEPQSVEFDVSSPNRRLAAFQRRRRIMGWALVATVDIGAVIVVVVSRGELLSRQISEALLALVVGWVAFAILGTGMGLHLVWKSAPGGETLRVDRAGLEIVYPDGEMDRVAFSDPELRLELYDFSAMSGVTYQGLLYSVVVRRRETEIPEPAYRAVYKRLSELGLIIRSARARSPLTPQSIQPMIHSARGPAAR
jgi:hypothetical protein